MQLTLCATKAHLSHPLQQRLQPSLITLAVTVQEGQNLGLSSISTPDTRAHQTWGVSSECVRGGNTPKNLPGTASTCALSQRSCEQASTAPQPPR